MDAYEALTAAYREKAKLASGASDAGMGNLFDEIRTFAESDLKQTEATAQELDFLAGVLSLAAHALRSSDATLSHSPIQCGNQVPALWVWDGYAVVVKAPGEPAVCSDAFTGERARDHALDYARAAARAFVAEEKLDDPGDAVALVEQHDMVVINAGRYSVSWTLEGIEVHSGPHPDLVPGFQDAASLTVKG